MGIHKNNPNTLTDEQKKKAEAASSPEELSAIAKEASMELTPDQLEGVSGGDCPFLKAPPPMPIL